MPTKTQEDIQYHIHPTAAINATMAEYCRSREEAIRCPRCGCELKSRWPYDATIYCDCCGQLISAGT